MPIHQLFPTPFYEGDLNDPALLEELAHSCRMLSTDDGAGKRWCRQNNYPGYTSYASLDDLPLRDPAFQALAKKLAVHARLFQQAAHLETHGRKLKLDSLWVNILKPGGMHSGHIHPHSIVSGTVYIELPEGAAPLKLEDPRLPMLMSAPARTEEAPTETRPFFYAKPSPGTVFMWESWLRHEVPAGTAKAPRISISFNYS